MPAFKSNHTTAIEFPNDLSLAEFQLLSEFLPKDVCNLKRFPAVRLYAIALEEAFLTNAQGPAAETLRTVANAVLVEGKPLRGTNEFETLLIPAPVLPPPPPISKEHLAKTFCQMWGNDTREVQEMAMQMASVAIEYCTSQTL